MLQRNKPKAADRPVYTVEMSECRGRLAYREYGDAKGTPVIFCHGWPSSSTMGELTDAAACELKIRIISPDRPGICNSTVMAERTLLDWTPIAARLADHIGLTDFHVLAVSGGAPYAFAMAWSMPERVRAIAVVSGAPPLADITENSGLLPIYRWLLALNRRAPAVLRAGFRVVRPFVSLKSSVHVARKLLRMLQPCDAEALRDAAAFNACFESQRRAWRGSPHGVMLDARIYAMPWGFPLEEVRVPVRLWHGKQDRSFSYRLAEDVAARLPNCNLRIVENGGHYSLPIRNMREILRDLIQTG